MKSQTIVLLLLLHGFIPISIIGQTKLIIDNQSKSLTAQLAIHYGESIELLDTILLNQESTTEYLLPSGTQGIYYLMMEDGSLVEFLLDYDQPNSLELSIKIDRDFMIKGSELSEKYHGFISINKKIIEQGQNRNLPKADNGNEQLQMELANLIAEGAKMDSKSLFSAYCKALNKPNMKTPSSTAESPEAFKDQLMLLSDKTLQGVDFSDERLIRTPIYTEKIKEYLSLYTPQTPMGLSKNASHLLQKATPSPEAYEFMSSYLLKHFGSKKNRAIYEFAYLDIINKEFLSGKANWASNELIKKLSNEYTVRKPSSLGQLAPNITVIESSGAKMSLNDLVGEYKILVFFSTECSICKKALPQIVSLFKKYHYLDIDNMFVCLDESSDCNKVYKRLSLTESRPCMQDPNSPSIAAAYNLTHTPTIFILDSKNLIINKGLTVKQLDQFLLSKALM